MAKLYGREYTKEELLRRVGDIFQVAGVRLARLDDGNELGTRVADLRTGSGFAFTVLLDRGMDIGPAELWGMALGWRSATMAAAPAFFEPEGRGFLRTFHGGLLCTCGLTYMGAPCTDEGKELGLHGRVSHIPATNVWADGKWEGDDYVFWVQGKVRETAVFQENLLLTRRIWARLGESRLFIEDVVENQGYERTPHMVLYHCNFGFPVVDEGTELIGPIKRTEPRDDAASPGLEKCRVMDAPTAGYKEQVFFHEMEADAEGMVTAALVNRSLCTGYPLALYVRYRQKELPCFTQWKMMGQGTYVVGLEPGNSLPMGRDKERAAGRLKFLEPGERVEYFLEIGALTSPEEIEKLEKASK